MFNQLKSITRGTSNHNPNQILTNIFVRIQEAAKGNSSQRHISFAKEDNEISKLQKCLREKSNTVISTDWQKRYKHHYQAHLERLSHFLVEGPGVWWTTTPEGVEFFDATQAPQSIICHITTDHLIPKRSTCSWLNNGKNALS